MDQKIKYKKRRVWTEKEEELFVQLWKERINQLRSQRKNSHVLLKMQNELEQRKVIVSVEEIKTKIHNLTTRYRAEKHKIRSSGGSPSSWSLFFEIKQFIGDFKENNLELVTEDSINEEKKTQILKDLY